MSANRRCRGNREGRLKNCLCGLTPSPSHLACAQTVLIKLADAMVEKVDLVGAPRALLSQPVVKAKASAPAARLCNAATQI